ncbi:hypothetical protein FHQ18_05260 [Deferribacter autotrophicus]|uniref:Uncharacterized protein n=1 Tax=Deferribacter autotrophicus TaxID=500465 RepID=A0A5A8F3W3_9BACT|nr:hypothetical protein [Deferribacter autotrophicus]KAA0258568.1 hypothetical protein FHQ18_05260 [Deferribacter autotrophicus]
MKKSIIILLSFLFISCASHYVKKKDDSLLFYLRDDSSKNIELYVDVDGFEKHKAEKIKNDIWVVKIKHPASKEIKYFYKVDGKLYIPDCELKEKDDFGGENCIFKNFP